MTAFSKISRLALCIALPLLVLLPREGRSELPEYILFQAYARQAAFISSVSDTLLNRSYPQPVAEISRLADQAKEKGDEQLSLAFRILHFRYLLSKGKSESGFENDVLEIAARAEANQWFNLQADALQLNADYCWEMKKKVSALEYYINAYSIYSEFPAQDFPNKAQYIYTYGGKYYHYTDFETAKHYFLEIWNTIPHDKNPVLYPTLNNIALCYSNLQQYDSAEYYYKTGLEMASQQNSDVWTGILSGNIANIYYLRGNYDQAIPLLEKDIELSLQAGEMINAAYSLARLGDIFLRKNQNKKGLELELKAYEIIKERKKQNDYLIVKTIYPAIAKAYAANGNMAAAYAFLDSGSVAKDSITQQRNILYLSGVQHKIEAAKHLAEMQKKESELRRQKFIRNVYIIGLALVIMLLFFVYRNYSNQRKANRKLKEAQDQLVRSEKMAAFGALASHVAHEIQNPLNFVNNFSEISEELVQEIMSTTSADSRTETGALLKDNLSRIVHHGKRVADIVKQLQQYSNAGDVKGMFDEGKNEPADL
jgi:preprotein translocase subunit YajC